MPLYARLLPDDTVAEVRKDISALPPDIPHKNVRWRNVVPEDLGGRNPRFAIVGQYEYDPVADTVSRSVSWKPNGEIKSLLIQEIRRIAAEKRELVANDEEFGEYALWLGVTIVERGQDKTQWPAGVQARYANILAWATAIGDVNSAMRTKIAEVKALTTPQALNVYDTTTGWP